MQRSKLSLAKSLAAGLALAMTLGSSVMANPLHTDSAKIVPGALLKARTLNGITVTRNDTSKTAVQVEGLASVVVTQWRWVHGPFGVGKSLRLVKASIDGVAFEAQALEPGNLREGIDYSTCEAADFKGCVSAQLPPGAEFILQVLGPLSTKRVVPSN